MQRVRFWPWRPGRTSAMSPLQPLDVQPGERPPFPGDESTDSPPERVDIIAKE